MEKTDWYFNEIWWFSNRAAPTVFLIVTLFCMVHRSQTGPVDSLCFIFIVCPLYWGFFLSCTAQLPGSHLLNQTLYVNGATALRGFARRDHKLDCENEMAKNMFSKLVCIIIAYSVFMNVVLSLYSMTECKVSTFSSFLFENSMRNCSFFYTVCTSYRLICSPNRDFTTSTHP